MKKFLLIFLLSAMGLCSVACAKPKQFEISLRDGLFQGTGNHNSGLTISAEFSEMDRMEYIKTTTNKVKDLSTIDTKFYTPYHINFVLSEGNENYVLDFGELVAQNSYTTDTYELKNIKGDAFNRALDIADIKLQLIDNDGNKGADELKIDYKLNGTADSAILKFISAGTESAVPHHNFEYNCRLTFDENIKFEIKENDLFYAGTVLNYSIYTVEGYKVIMYVNNEPYTEIEPSGIEVMNFKYVTGYGDVNINFRSVKTD